MCIRDRLKARLLAAGADMNRVLVLTADDYFGKTGQPLTLKDQALADFCLLYTSKAPGRGLRIRCPAQPIRVIFPEKAFF